MRSISFHVVVPSLPGYFLSSYPYIDSWDVNKSAEYIHKLMVDVLGYKKYAGQGGDWVRIDIQFTAPLDNIVFRSRDLSYCES